MSTPESNNIPKSIAVVIEDEDDDDNVSSRSSSPSDFRSPEPIPVRGDSASKVFPRYNIPLAPAKPFLMPSFEDGAVVEILPSEKPNKKIQFDENILVQEIENRFAFIYPEDDEDDSYEIEIVEDDGEADFYLEIVDGEVFYVFETEDDISVGSDDGNYDMDEDDSDLSDDDQAASSGKVKMSITDIAAPNLDSDDFISFSENNHTQSKNPEIHHDSEMDDSTPTTKVEEEFVSKKADTPALIEREVEDMETEPIHEMSPKGNLREDADAAMLETADTVDSALLLADSSDEVRTPGKASEQDPGTCIPVPISVTVEEEQSSGFDEQQQQQQQQQSVSTPPANESSKLEVTSISPQPVSLPPPPTGVYMLSPPSSPQNSKNKIMQQVIVDNVPHTPIASPIAPASPASSRGRFKSILKANPESPKKPMSKFRRAEKKKGKKEKTFTKTYVRADHYDGEHRVYNWEKPDWTKKQLRSTGMGEAARKGQNLANPITFPVKKPANAELLEFEENDSVEQVNKEELIRRIKGGTMAIPLAPLPGYKRNQRKLKFSIQGAMIRDGGDIVKPITKATVFRKPENINKLANRDVLKMTPVGEQVRRGKTLSGPITKATVIRKPDDINKVANPNVLKKKGIQPVEKKKYEWEKPAWMKTKLQATDLGSFVKEGKKVESPITHLEKKQDNYNPEATSINLRPTREGRKLIGEGNDREVKEKKYEWQKPDWIKAKLEPTKKGEAVKHGETLSNPITFPIGKSDGINKEVQPDEILRQSDLGDVVRQGETLARPITQLPDLVRKEENEAQQ